MRKIFISGIIASVILGVVFTSYLIATTDNNQSSQSIQPPYEIGEKISYLDPESLEYKIIERADRFYDFRIDEHCATWDECNKKYAEFRDNTMDELTEKDLNWVRVYHDLEDFLRSIPVEEVSEHSRAVTYSEIIGNASKYTDKVSPGNVLDELVYVEGEVKQRVSSHKWSHNFYIEVDCKPVPDDWDCNRFRTSFQEEGVMIKIGDYVRVYGPIQNITYNNKWFEDPYPFIEGFVLEFPDPPHE